MAARNKSDSGVALPDDESRTTLRRIQHDMRTPLGQIIGYSEMLQEEVEDRGQSDLVPDLERIRAAATQLLGLVNDLFQPKSPAAGGAAAAVPSRWRRAVTAVERATGTLLVVDDEPGNRDMLARRLGRAGYQVRTAADGQEALLAIDEGDIDLVLLDVLMPGMSGLEVLQTLRETHPSTRLPVIMTTALDTSEKIVESLELGANDYVTKPFDYPVVLARVAADLERVRSARRVEALARELELRNAFIRRTFGRYLSDDIVASLLEDPEGLEMRGEKRVVTFLLSDLRGFSSLVEALEPTQVVAILNNHLGTMAEIVKAHGGTIDEFIGDAILAFFGAPVAHDDDPARAIACAIDMQRAMADVNARNRARGLPEIEMGIGITTGEVIVGNLGSEARAKYGAVGSAVNLAARIESYTLGGEILISQSTFEACAEVRTRAPRSVHPKGFDTPLAVHAVLGLGERELPEEGTRWSALSEPVVVHFALLEGKSVASSRHRARIVELSHRGAVLEAPEPVAELSEIRLEFSRSGSGDTVYAKVVSGSSDLDRRLTVRFTSRSETLVALVETTFATES